MKLNILSAIFGAILVNLGAYFGGFNFNERGPSAVGIYLLSIFVSVMFFALSKIITNVKKR